ncbi:FAD/NAD(P)-binding domain-containing protein [Viridothelium virens]|uniref:FAD/NAD(P)-binding domain-containing protein n=1 Tax=Viridothelium virens TaxID=1048519 RepID=A0A6A6HID9_VIRVR|nr:FAD/NAD(P)-binding domain-containing protein [Viridothelium virens]
MSTQNEIVIVGASFAGLGAAHYFLKHILPLLKSQGDGKYHVTLVDSSSHFYFRVGSPRSMVSKQMIPDSKLFLPIADGFKQYSTSDFTFIQATATDWDPNSRTITISLAHTGKSKTLNYHALILATGTRTATPLTSLHGDHTTSQQALDEMNSALLTAQSIIIGGGGPSGVETAGEIGHQLNGYAGWFRARPSNPKARITLYSGSDKMLPMLRPAASRQAETYLAKVGVDVVHGVKVVGSEARGDGQTVVRFANGEESAVDVYVPSVGVTPNTGFVPQGLKNERGYVKTNAKTLRVDEAGPRVYAIGDVGSYTRGGVMDIYDAVPVVMTNVKADLMAGSSVTDEKARAKVQDRLYEPNLKETQIVPVGRSKGVGAVFGWKLPSFMVWLIKGRDYMVAQAQVMVNGTKWEKESKWTPRDG